MAILGVDVGGTFTDAVLLDGGVLRTAKVPTAVRQEDSVLEAVRAVGAAGVERFAHGTTVAMNARVTDTARAWHQTWGWRTCAVDPGVARTDDFKPFGDVSRVPAEHGPYLARGVSGGDDA